MDNALIAGDVWFPGHAETEGPGQPIPGYAALPQGSDPTGGVVVIHHMPGFDDGTKEIIRRLGSWGFAALGPNLHHREASGADSDDAAAANRAAGGVPDERLVGDVGGARDYLLGLPNSNGKIGVIGFCSGGRQSVLAACHLPLDAAIDCYGAFVLTAAPAGSGLEVPALTDLLPGLSCPLLGIFGNDDSHPAPAEVDELDRLLDELGKPHTFHRFDGAGHAFMAADRPNYRVEQARDAWSLTRDFLRTHLQTPSG